MDGDRAKQAHEVFFWRKIVHPPFYFNNDIVKLTHTLKYLGLQLDNKISFSEHSGNKISKATKAVGLLRKLQSILPRGNVLIIYKSFMKPHLD